MNSHAKTSANGRFLIIKLRFKTFRINVKYKKLMSFTSIEVLLICSYKLTFEFNKK